MRIRCAHISPSSGRYHVSVSRGTRGCVCSGTASWSCAPKKCVQTGRSKHYGFIEFASAPVAQIVAETMDNYLLMGHILTCKVIPKDEVHPELWVGANRKWRVVPTYRLAQAQHNKVSSFAICLNSRSLMWGLAASKREATARRRKTLAEQTRSAETEACRSRDCVQLRQSWICECRRALYSVKAKKNLLLRRKSLKLHHDNPCGSCTCFQRWLPGTDQRWSPDLIGRHLGL